ncbi:MAG: calcium-binding EGF-like domain-containing protein [Bacteroidetes bacterium]|nr:calcium-binding EGF-like domain-containing protein [Bacteroidota bacterium]
MFKTPISSIRLAMLAASITLFAFTAVTYTSCKKDKCKDVTCQNGGTCSDGNCTCPTGYSGTLCETGSAAKFIGTWYGDDCSGNPASIEFDAGGDGISLILPSTIGNGACVKNIAIHATANGNTVTIPSQHVADLCNTNGGTFSGSGSINGVTLTVNFTAVADAGGTEHVCFTGTK